MAAFSSRSCLRGFKVPWRYSAKRRVPLRAVGRPGAYYHCTTIQLAVSGITPRKTISWCIIGHIGRLRNVLGRKKRAKHQNIEPHGYRRARISQCEFHIEKCTLLNIAIKRYLCIHAFHTLPDFARRSVAAKTTNRGNCPNARRYRHQKRIEWHTQEKQGAGCFNCFLLH